MRATVDSNEWQAISKYLLTDNFAKSICLWYFTTHFSMYSNYVGDNMSIDNVFRQWLQTHFEVSHMQSCIKSV